MSTSFHSDSRLPSLQNLALILSTSIAVLTVAKIALNSSANSQRRKKVIPSPRETVLPGLTKEESDDLPYPIDGPGGMQGGRNVSSRYGTMRVYEWGPESGRKVLLVHGISTPSLALRSIALSLSQKGCRVMLFDLFGRGWSDSPDLPHDPRLYTTQILLALTSSPIPWTPEGFSMIGYSLGGGISADFTADFPHLVHSLVLLAPAGLIRSSHFGKLSRLMYSGYIPEEVMEWVAKRRLGAARAKPVRKSGDENDPTTKEELKGNRDPKFDAVELRPGVPIGVAAQWQLDHHQGYLRSFVSSIRNSSIEGKDSTFETWKKLGTRGDRIMVIAGSEDAVIIAGELKEDICGLIGEQKLVWHVVNGGHDFPISKAEEVASLVSEFWAL